MSLEIQNLGTLKCCADHMRQESSISATKDASYIIESTTRKMIPEFFVPTAYTDLRSRYLVISFIYFVYKRIENSPGMVKHFLSTRKGTQEVIGFENWEKSLNN